MRSSAGFTSRSAIAIGRTIAMRISDLKIDAAENHFQITYTADHRERDIDFHWNATIRGPRKETFRSRCKGKLDPRSCATASAFVSFTRPSAHGTPCRIVQEFGEVVEKPFPRLIAPAPKEDPFQEIREMSYRVADGVWADLRFEGDIFETEDRRNWIDGSFKTFCTPLRLPFPVTIEVGSEVSQRVELRLRAERTMPALQVDRCGLDCASVTRHYRFRR